MTAMQIAIDGPAVLTGSIPISGAKNSALPVLAAVCLSAEPITIANLPRVADIQAMLAALGEIGAEGDLEGGTITVQVPRIQSALVPAEITAATRASVLLLGPMLARHGHVQVSLPGGCAIGERKIDYHIEGLRQMGAVIEFSAAYITGRCAGLRAIDFTFPAKTVTGTENLVMAAVCAQGTTVLRNCSLEPEVGDLVDMLSAMGARIAGKDSETLTITGQDVLHGCRHRIIPDRIEAGTYLIAAAFAGNDLTVGPLVVAHQQALLDILALMGVDPRIAGDHIRITGHGDLRPVDVVTEPFPAFPTDLQAQLTTLMTQARGVSSMRETIFNNRFRHAGELAKLGAAIAVSDDTVRVTGPAALHGASLTTTDLRASAALVLGGLIAQGRTVIGNAGQLFRGYEDMAGKLQKVGARITINPVQP
jgi:UDP-N-acetylglucosamine 1-carboxyvinyltransferase